MSVRIMVGHVLDELAKLPEQSVHCIWTSVPYWGLRAYGTEPQVWGGNSGCNHEWTNATVLDTRHSPEGQRPGDVCSHCGAWNGEHGLEPTLQAWLQHEVVIWRALRRVLRKDGVAWLNVGDAYAGSWGAQSRDDAPGPLSTLSGGQVYAAPKGTCTGSIKRTPGLKPKDRIMMPARLAIALCDDGWYLRDEIVWFKKNPMPSSVRDRTTPAHEMLYLLTRSARYYYDGEAIKEQASQNTNPRRAGNGYKMPDNWDTADGAHGSFHRRGREKGRPALKLAEPGSGIKNNESMDEALAIMPADRNKRSVWPLASEPFPGAHFATAPTALVEPCILAGTSETGCCPRCGAPWSRMTGDATAADGRGSGNKERFVAAAGERGRTNTHVGSSVPRAPTSILTVGWKAGCGCEHNMPIPCTVIDPFGGSGTSALVADRLGRDCILVELNPEYAAMARRRIEGDSPLFAEVAAE